MTKPCPVCGKPPQPKHEPFCSARCQQVDLHRWMGEVYRIDGGETLPERGDDGDDEE